jgi:hypothetical protein
MVHVETAHYIRLEIPVVPAFITTVLLTTITNQIQELEVQQTLLCIAIKSYWMYTDL